MAEKRGIKSAKTIGRVRETEKTVVRKKDGKCDRKTGRKNLRSSSSKKLLNRWRTTVGARLGALDPATAAGRGGDGKPGKQGKTKLKGLFVHNMDE
jgi:hypothetical protein